jgi:carboxypeptidase C (cathepsin A)
MPDWTLEGYQKIIEAGERGRKTLIEAAKLEYEQKLKTYNQNPKLCKHCLISLSFEKYINKSIYCSRSCAAKVNNKKRVKNKSVFLCCFCNKTCLNAKNTTGKYCSLKCSAADKTKTKIEAWLNGTCEPSVTALRKYLKELKPAQCEICQLTNWNNLPIPLEMDHKDGNYKNNHLDNLRLLCPNCHAQTPTYKSKNRGNGRAYRRERWRVGQTC